MRLFILAGAEPGLHVLHAHTHLHTHTHTQTHVHTYTHTHTQHKSIFTPMPTYEGLRMCTPHKTTHTHTLTHTHTQPDAGDYDKRTALHIAACEGNLSMSDVILSTPEAAKCLEAKDRWGKTPIEEAEREVSMRTPTNMHTYMHIQGVWVGVRICISSFSSLIEFSASISVCVTGMTACAKPNPFPHVRTLYTRSGGMLPGNGS